MPKGAPPAFRYWQMACVVLRMPWYCVNLSLYFDPKSMQQISFFEAYDAECHATCPSANSQLLPLLFGLVPP